MAPNESATTFAWLSRSLEVTRQHGLACQAWQEVRDRMRPAQTLVRLSSDWVSDPWLARGVAPTAITTVAPAWEPPDALDEWPAFGADRLVERLPGEARRTRVQDLPGDHFGWSADAEAAVFRFHEMEAEIAAHGDTRMVQGEHVRACLLTAVGPPLLGVLLSPGSTPRSSRR